MTDRIIFTSESVSEGHPDKVADIISDAILDAHIDQDPNAHVACETALGKGIITNFGEITSEAIVNHENVVKDVIREIGYMEEGECYEKDLDYYNFLNKQSPDIAQGVNRKSKEEQGAGDQGMVFGYATNETPERMPAPIMLAHKILLHFHKLRLRKDSAFSFLRPDAKSQVSVIYENGKPIEIDSVVLSHQTTEEGATEDNYHLLAREICDLLERQAENGIAFRSDTNFFINPTGRFVLGGPDADSGLTGRKIIVDTYGGMGRHGGGAFSGKDPSKVDRSAAYYARYVAKHLVEAELCERAEIQIAYAIGRAQPVSVFVNSFGTSYLTNAGLSKLVQKLVDKGALDFTPYGIIKTLGLKNPDGWRYQDTASYGHFGRALFPWEKINQELVWELRMTRWF